MKSLSKSGKARVDASHNGLFKSPHALRHSEFGSRAQYLKAYMKYSSCLTKLLFGNDPDILEAHSHLLSLQPSFTQVGTSDALSQSRPLV